VTATDNHVRRLASYAADLRGKLDVAFRSRGADLKASRTLESIYEQLDAGIMALEDAERQVRAIVSDGSRSQQFKSEQIGAIVATARTESTDAMTTATSELAALRARLAALALPARPSDDVLSEARIAGLKTDSRMVLDSAETDALVGAMADLLRHYVARADALGVWLMAGSSDFPQLYVRSRLGNVAADAAMQDYTGKLPAILMPIMPDAATNARRLLDLFDGQGGLVQIVDLTRQAVNGRLQLLDALANPQGVNLIGAS
jgi:hypothetical protein